MCEIFFMRQALTWLLNTLKVLCQSRNRSAAGLETSTVAPVYNIQPLLVAAKTLRHEALMPSRV